MSTLIYISYILCVCVCAFDLNINYALMINVYLMSLSDIAWKVWIYGSAEYPTFGNVFYILMKHAKSLVGLENKVQFTSEYIRN